MSNTCNPSITTSAQPGITDPLKYILYKASDPTTPISTQQFSSPHPQRLVRFLSMPKVNLIFRLFQVTGGGDVDLNVKFDLVPDDDTLVFYAPVEIMVDVDPGVVSGATSFTYDGTAGTPDWRGRTARPNRVGQGPMQSGVQYSWDGTTGIFTLLQSGDKFNTGPPGELFFFTFDIIVAQGGLTVASLWTAVKVVTTTTSLVAGDIGKKIIIKGGSPYFVVTLPDISLIPEQVVTFFEFGRASHTNVKILATGTTFDWGKDGSRTYITGGICENLAIYKEPTTGVLRVHSYEGNFLTIGTIISTDADITQLCNVQELDGSNMAVATFKRLYEDYVQKLPPAQVCNYTDWATGSNKYKFSYSDGTNFHVPDRRTLYSRATDGTQLAGVYLANQNASHSHRVITGGIGGYAANPGSSLGRQNYNGDAYAAGVSSLGPYIETVGGSESRPETYIKREYILI